MLNKMNKKEFYFIIQLCYTHAGNGDLNKRCK